MRLELVCVSNDVFCIRIRWPPVGRSCCRRTKKGVSGWLSEATGYTHTSTQRRTKFERLPIVDAYVALKSPLLIVDRCGCLPRGLQTHTSLCRESRLGADFSRKWTIVVWSISLLIAVFKFKLINLDKIIQIKTSAFQVKRETVCDS